MVILSCFCKFIVKFCRVGHSADVVYYNQYDVASRTIAPYGVVIIFANAQSPSPMNDGLLQVLISSTACSVTISKKQEECYLYTESGFSVGMMEKTVSQWWSKYIVLISTAQ